MPDQIFYVGSAKGKEFTGYVPAKFLMRNSAYVTDPTPGGSQGTYLYSGPLGSDKTDGSVANPNNYLIVPANYTEQKARDFAARSAKTVGRDYPEDETSAGGLHQALGQMFGAFMQGVRRTCNGIRNGEFKMVPSFRLSSAARPTIWDM